MVKPLTPVHIFIDESESAECDGVGILVIPDRHLSEVEISVQKLRRWIRKQMVAYAYPVLEIQAKRTPQQERIFRGEYPELHSTEMWNSVGTFYFERSDDLLRRHRSWLKKSLKLLNPNIMSFYIRSYDRRPGRKKSSLITNYIDNFVNFDQYKINRKRFESSVRGDVVQAYAEALVLISRLNREGFRVLSVTIDDGQKGNILRKSIVAERLQSYVGQPAFKIDFADSFDSPGLQLADLATFFFIKRFAYSANKETEEVRLYDSYVDRIFTPNNHVISVDSWDRISGNLENNDVKVEIAVRMALFCEMALIKSGGLQSSSQDRKSKLDEIIKILMDDKFHAHH